MSEVDLTQIFDYVFMAMLLSVGIAIVRLRSLFAVAMLTGVYSLLSAAWFLSLDAVDVSFTEAAVGAGISTVLLLGAMLLTARECDPVPISRHWAAFAVVAATGAALFYALGDMPVYGDPNSPANAYVGADYMARTPETELYALVAVLSRPPETEAYGPFAVFPRPPETVS